MRVKPVDDFGSLFDPAPAPGPGPLGDAHDASPSAPATSAMPAADAVTPGLGPESVVDGRVVLHDGVEYRALLLWSRAYDAFVANGAVCQEFAPAYMSDLLILREDGLSGSRRGTYTHLVELVAVKDECRGDVKRFIWRFANPREIHPRPGVCDWPTGRGGQLGRVTFVDTVQLSKRSVL